MATVGIYEKALPKDTCWAEKLDLAKSLGFDFVEMSIDETDRRLHRLRWPPAKRRKLRNIIFDAGIPIQSICLSGHRRFPLGSLDPDVRATSLEMMRQAIQLSVDLGARQIQLAGYDVYYEEKSAATRNYFLENLKKCVDMAAERSVVLAIETMDDPFINSITKFLSVKQEISSSYLQVYPDVGNLSAWPENDPCDELEKGISSITAIHLKDTLKVTDDFPGKFRDVPFGTGCVDFVECFRSLKRLGYSGAFVVEMWSENSEEPVKEIIQAKKLIDTWMQEAYYNENIYQ